MYNKLSILIQRILFEFENKTNDNRQDWKTRKSR